MWHRFADYITKQIQHIVEYAKHLNFFMKLRQQDQIILLRASSFEILLLRLARCFNSENKTMLFEGRFTTVEAFNSLGKLKTV